MPIKPNHPVSAVLLAITLASCATSNPPDDFSFDFSSAKTSDFDGHWI
jgi:hypothetical protein